MSARASLREHTETLGGPTPVRDADGQPHPSSLRPLLIAEQIEPILRVSRQRIYEMARLGIFPAGVVVRLGRQVRFDEDALLEWMRNGGSPAG